ncbi:MAG TPA: glutamate--tRNA ligase [Gemmatales bacterium]|nr:glutamate--tRNA ligase [Gemmatales bacterium]HMP16459.1 glutamate--tRNA ligase [Gemmatales bacterium]
MPIRTRFAPSPTGYLHIGGVRTALFNWLYARRHGGQFILRIDDTDAERNQAAALLPILEGFRWLGLNWDEGPTPDGLDSTGPHAPYFQSRRNHLYVEAAMKLLQGGLAYPDTMTKEQLETERKAAEAAKKAYCHRGPNRDLPAEENLRIYQEKPVALRLKVPLGQTLVIEDHIRGRVEFQTDLLGDPIILRAPDATGVCRALYNFATVVDDIAMEITHVIRAAEHLSNTPIQLLVYQALGAPVPQFAHVPVVNYKGDKMSKRKLPPLTKDEMAKLKSLGWKEEQIQARTDLNLATVAYYRELGYLPAALINYLGRLGWSLDDKTEFIPLPDMIAHFSLERVNNAPGNFDADKLYWLASEYMKRLPLEDKVEGSIPYLQQAGLIEKPATVETRQKLMQVMEACGDRLKLFSDVLTYGSFFFQKPVYDEQAFSKRVKKEGIPALLGEYTALLRELPLFEKAALEQSLHAFCESRSIKQADMNHAIRLAITGVPVGPGLFDCLAILGKEESLARLEAALAKATGMM